MSCKSQKYEAKQTFSKIQGKVAHKPMYCTKYKMESAEMYGLILHALMKRGISNIFLTNSLTRVKKNKGDSAVPQPLVRALFIFSHLCTTLDGPCASLICKSSCQKHPLELSKFTANSRLQVFVKNS